MKKLIVKLALSLALTCSIVNLTYNLATPRPVVQHKIVEAPWYPIWPIFILINAVWKKVNGSAPGKGIVPKPEKHSTKPN